MSETLSSIPFPLKCTQLTTLDTAATFWGIVCGFILFYILLKQSVLDRQGPILNRGFINYYYTEKTPPNTYNDNKNEDDYRTAEDEDEGDSSTES